MNKRKPMTYLNHFLHTLIGAGIALGIVFLHGKIMVVPPAPSPNPVITPVLAHTLSDFNYTGYVSSPEIVAWCNESGSVNVIAHEKHFGLERHDFGSDDLLHTSMEE